MESSVLVVASTGEASGVVSYVSALARAVPYGDYVVAVPPSSDLERSLPTGARTIPLVPGRRGMRELFAKYKHQFAVVQTHGARALSAARLAHVPARSLNHVFHEFPRASQRRSWIELASAVGVRRTANSPALAASLQRIRLPTSEVLTPVLLPHDSLSREEARNQLGLPEESLAAVVVGRLHPAKCPTLAIDAIAAASRHLATDIELVFFGDGPLRNAIGRRAQMKSVAVSLPGRVSGARSLLTAFDVVIVPSLHETFCISLAEAALAGVPVAAVDSPGSRLLSFDGRLVPLARPTAGAVGREIVSALERTDSERNDLCHYVERRFSVEAGGGVYAAHFRALLAGRSR